MENLFNSSRETKVDSKGMNQILNWELATKDSFLILHTPLSEEDILSKLVSPTKQRIVSIRGLRFSYLNISKKIKNAWDFSTGLCKIKNLIT